MHSGIVKCKIRVEDDHFFRPYITISFEGNPKETQTVLVDTGATVSIFPEENLPKEAKVEYVGTENRTFLAGWEYYYKLAEVVIFVHGDADRMRIPIKAQIATKTKFLSAEIPQNMVPEFPSLFGFESLLPTHDSFKGILFYAQKVEDKKIAYFKFEKNPYYYNNVKEQPLA